MSTGDCLAAGAIEVGDSGLDIRPRRCRFAPLQVSPASPRVVAIEPRYTRRTRRLTSQPWLGSSGFGATNWPPGPRASGMASFPLADRGTREHSSDASSADQANAGPGARARRRRPLRGKVSTSRLGGNALGGCARSVAMAPGGAVGAAGHVVGEADRGRVPRLGQGHRRSAADLRVGAELRPRAWPLQRALPDVGAGASPLAERDDRRKVFRLVVGWPCGRWDRGDLTPAAGHAARARRRGAAPCGARHAAS